MRPFSVCRALIVVLVTFFGPTMLARAQSQWTGLASPDNNWTTVGNWDVNGVPAAGGAAVFNGNGNGNTSINLGGTAQPIRDIIFDTASAAAYTIGQLAGDALNFDGNGTLWINPGVTTAQTFNAAIQTQGSLLVQNSVSNGGTGNGLAGLTLGDINIGGSGTFLVDGGTGSVANTTTILNGDITETSGQPGILYLRATTAGASNDTNFVINGNNSHTGGTTIQMNTGSNGSLQVGTDTAFGTGKVTNILQGNSPQLKALNGTRTIANTMDLNGGLTFVGTDSFVFTGPITIIQANVGGSRTLNNSIATAGSSVTFGASPGSSTITLGNPVSNGGDGAGKTLILAPQAGATFVMNAVMQDPAAGGGTASGIVQYGGVAGGTTVVNSLNTYTGNTIFNGGNSVIQFNHDYNVGNPSGPFGLGSLTFTNSTNNFLQPIGGNRTIANPLVMDRGFTVTNAASDSSGVTFTGPISLLTAGRTIQNNFTAGTGGILTLGSAATPSTLTLPTTAGQTLTVTGTGATVINDVIQDSGAFTPATSITVSSTGSYNANALNTYKGNTTLSGAGTIVPITVSSNALPGVSFTAGPFGTGTLIPNNGSNQHLRPTGGDRSISNAITMNTGFAMDNVTGETWNLTFAGPITMTNNNGRTISNGFTGFTTPGGTLTLGSSTAPSTITLGNWTTGATQPSLSFATLSGNIVVNDTIVDPAGLTQPYKVQINPAAGEVDSVIFNAASTYTGPTTVSFGSLLVNNTTGSATGTGAVSAAFGSTIGGTGRISGALTNSGTIAPGAPGGSPGTLTAAGNVTDADGSAWAIELNGASADKLVVGGALDLSASDSLNVTGPGTGSSWVIATYTGALTGTFDFVTSGYTVNYGSGINSQITLNVAVGLPGDFNSDGKVDAGDYVTWRKNNGTNNALANDGGLGTPISPAHYNLWRQNFGNPPGAGSSGALTSGTIPEPASIPLALVGVAVFSWCRARHKQNNFVKTAP